MNLGPEVVADEQPVEVMEPDEGALDDPAGVEPGAVLGAAAGDLGAIRCRRRLRWYLSWP